jgi:hypothetical protein
MTVLVDYDEDQCQLVVHAACKDLSDREIDNTLRVCPKTLGRIAEFSEHEAY